MNQPARVRWWVRLLLAFASLFPALLGFLLVTVIRDSMWMPQDFHWGNAGEEQIVGYFAIVVGFGALITYVLFIAPLVLLWPVRSQLKHWYAMLLVSLLWLPPAGAVAGNARPEAMLHDLLHPFHPDILWFLEPFAPLACGVYLLLLHRAVKRARREDRRIGTPFPSRYRM